MHRLLTLFFIFLRLGCTSFGGPAAHIGFFRDEFVRQRQWLSEAEFGSLLALAQLLPGPASSQLGFAIGLHRAGLPGAVLAFIGFTLPSVCALLVFAAAMAYPQLQSPSLGHALKLLAVAVVFQALKGMLPSLCPDLPRRIMAVSAAVLLLFLPGISSQLVLIGAGMAMGVLWLRLPPTADTPAESSVSRSAALSALLLFSLLFTGLPLIADTNAVAHLASIFYQAGALVFGGGHVVLPLLESSVTPHLVSQELFLSGYGAAQLVPGPVFSFAAYLGAVMDSPLNSYVSALIATLAIFLPGFLLIIALLPFWHQLNRYPRFFRAVAGANAVVAGILAATLIHPMASVALLKWTDIPLLIVIWLALRKSLWLALALSVTGAVFL